jgi:hypothetical protein
MDLRLFHPKEFPDREFKTMDRFNSWTRLQPCRLLEWTGWYDGSVPFRLLGHYRLFHLYKKSYHKRSVDIPTVQGYILQRRITYGLKYRFNNFLAFVPKIWGYPDRTMEIHIINRMLLNERASILQEFLSNAEIDFEAALLRAIEQIHAPSFLSTPGISNINTSNTLSQNILVQVKQDYNTNNYHASWSHNELNIHPVIKEELPAKEPSAPSGTSIHGKQKDVFSKKQVLILLDLLSQSTKIESFNLQNPNKHEPLALFLHALTGKGIETWLEELKNFRNKGLYDFRDASELEYIVKTMTNLSNTLRTAGLKTLAKQVNNKISELKVKR